MLVYCYGHRSIPEHPSWNITRDLNTGLLSIYYSKSTCNKTEQDYPDQLLEVARANEYCYTFEIMDSLNLYFK